MSMTIALAGNPNCGKTTLFNELTGAKQHVGNWPGVTVEKKDGIYRKDKTVTILDLPGTYSLSPYSAEELVARDYIVKDKPDAVINIVDGTSIERNLYLTLQILETRIPMVVAMNMMDEVEARGDKIDCEKLSGILGIPVIPITARGAKGLNELMDAAVAVAREGKQTKRLSVFDSEMEQAIEAIAHVLGSSDPAEDYWKAVKLVEQDQVVSDSLSEEMRRAVKPLVDAAGKHAGGDGEAGIADSR